MAISTESLKRTGFTAANRVYTGLRQLHSNHQAHAVLRSVESQRGPTDKHLLHRAEEYAREVLGSVRYAPWLQVYAAVSGAFKEGWIPDNYYGLVVDPLKSGEAAKVALVKSFTNRILDTEALPDLAYVIDGNYYGRDYRPIDEAHLVSILFAEDSRAIFKADNSYQGRAIRFMTPEDFPRRGEGPLPDGVFQAPIHQHDFFAQISPRSTATLRITTAREPDGKVAVRAAYLRVGRAEDDVVSSRSHVRVALDIRTGALADEGYLHDWRRIETHPDTGFRFAGQAVPRFDEAVRLCIALHASCPHMLCLGWDLCIDRDERVRIMEWNARYNDIKFSEATTGPCFRGLGWENLWRSVPA
ncbi:sugar-transfer associated ATP-grasp domain-containing protein [Fulvimonas yonginensis]|uniref:Sugar-transfer associated ATP-grasp domain-containing protein n=1 Tax=Fulvimonas yonginensis TaxID=1495200 RepID=A0ABU8JF95_9GAMM